MSRPVLLDYCSGAGGAAMGYHHAGFDVVGVDVVPQPRFPFRFIRADITTLGLAELVAFTGAVALHGSPPCQRASRLRHYQPATIDDKYADLIPGMRADFAASGLPYVIENVPQAELLNPVELCGAMFDLPMYRHRHFETNWQLQAPVHPPHIARCTRNGYLPTPEAPAR